MIRYRLICDQSHEFDGWFHSGAAFDEQAAAGQLSCPVCGSRKVTKGLMTPSVTTGKRVEQRQQKRQLARLDKASSEVVDAMRKVREHIMSTAENVGDKFAEEARKIHYEEAEPRGIYGRATREEVVEMHDEGVDFHPLPELPEDKN